MKLEKLFEKQIKLQQRLGNNDLVGNQEFINTMTIALIDELMEAIRETPWKPWKKQQLLNQENFKEELIDAWHFLINLSLAAGMDAEDVYNRFIEKNKENHNRQDKGY